MKKICFYLSFLFLASAGLQAQPPQMMSFQSVIRNGSNQLLANAPVGMRVSILQGSATGATVFSERHNATTNANGLVTLAVGAGTVLSGSFSAINWGAGPFFIKSETDPNAGNNYTITTTTQLLSVPYALFSGNGIPGGGTQGQVITYCDGVPIWTKCGECPGKITQLNCASATHSGTLTSGSAASGVGSTVPYAGGNGGVYAAQSVSSTGVTGLTATLAAGTFATGAGSLSYTISGTPSAGGTASFSLNIGGQTCTLTRIVTSPAYPAGTVHCIPMPTAVVNVTSPATGKIWMDRNFGASQQASGSADFSAFGDLFQWGRRADGHQCRTSPTTSTLSSTDQPAHGNFILASSSPLDWRSPQNGNLWQGVSGVNNPCPAGYRLPSSAEFNSERLSWSSNNAAGAFTSPLKLTKSGFRFYDDGSLTNISVSGGYWSSTVSSFGSTYLYITDSDATMTTIYRAMGFSVRCIKD